jgi:CMP-N-acetylneuraminic acid synthetase
MKKIITTLIAFLFLTNCGYSPVYLNQNFDFKIKSINNSRENQLNSKINRNLISFSNHESQNIITLGLDAQKKTNVLAKDSKGDPSRYEMIVSIKLEIKYEPDILVLLEPTSPFREKKLITKCITKMLETNSDSIATFKPAKTHPDRCWHIDRFGRPVSHSKKKAWEPRQQLNLAYELDGSLYAFKINPKINLRKGLLFGKSISFVYSGENKVEIDDAKDIQYANYIVENFNEK